MHRITGAAQLQNVRRCSPGVASATISCVPIPTRSRLPCSCRIGTKPSGTHHNLKLTPELSLFPGLISSLPGHGFSVRLAAADAIQITSQAFAAFWRRASALATKSLYRHYAGLSLALASSDPRIEDGSLSTHARKPKLHAHCALRDYPNGYC